MADTVLAILIGMNLILTTAVFRKLYGKTAEQKLDEDVERSVTEQEMQRRSREMDEGFDNLMRYSVKGMDGFGGVT